MPVQDSGEHDSNQEDDCHMKALALRMLCTCHIHEKMYQVALNEIDLAESVDCRFLQLTSNTADCRLVLFLLPCRLCHVTAGIISCW